MLFINKLCPDWAQGTVWSFTALLYYKCNLQELLLVHSHTSLEFPSADAVFVEVVVVHLHYVE